MSMVLCALVLVLLCTSLQQLVLLTLSSRNCPSRQFERQRHTVSVVVPCFNEQVVLRATLEAILASEDVDITRIICVDDGSSDATLAIMRDMRQRQPNIVVLSQPNRGKAAALNLGLKAVETEIFVSIDADTQVMPGTIATLLGAFDDPLVAAVSGHMLVGNRQPANPFVHRGQVREYEQANNIERQALSTLQRLSLIPGAVGAFRSATVKELGGYPEGTLAEDAYLTLLILIAGHRIVHRSSALVLTEAPDTLAGLYRQRVRWATGKIQVVVKTASAACRPCNGTTMIWLMMTVDQTVAALFKVPALVLLPTLTFVSVIQENSGWQAITLSVLSLITKGAASLISFRIAHARDMDRRHLAGMREMPLQMTSTAIVPVVTCLATWVGWSRVLLRRRGTWGKLQRRGDVQVVQERADGRH